MRKTKLKEESTSEPSGLKCPMGSIQYFNSRCTEFCGQQESTALGSFITLRRCSEREKPLVQCHWLDFGVYFTNQLH